MQTLQSYFTKSMRGPAMYLLALSIASCSSPVYNNSGAKHSPNLLLESGCTTRDYGPSQGCIIEIPEEIHSPNSVILPSNPMTMGKEMPEAPAQELPAKPHVDVYFEINCGHCNDYKKMLAEEKVQERFPQFQFNLICVELPGFGEAGRCQGKYGNDGRAEYGRLTQKLGREPSTPTTLVNGKELRDPWQLTSELEQLL